MLSVTLTHGLGSLYHLLQRLRPQRIGQLVELLDRLWAQPVGKHALFKETAFSLGAEVVHAGMHVVGHRACHQAPGLLAAGIGHERLALQMHLPLGLAHQAQALQFLQHRTRMHIAGNRLDQRLERRLRT